MNFFEELLKDRKSPYEIDLELFIRKAFEKKTHYSYEFSKNEDKYGYDLTVYKYFIEGPDYTKKPIAYIEIEVSENWKTTYPEYWEDYSFLKRKVFVYDYDNNIYTKKKKRNVEDTIYIIFNRV